MSDQLKRYQCRHILTDGRRCGSPCLRGEEFCYYHHTTRRPVENCIERNLRMSSFLIPMPEDRQAIQATIGEVLQRIASRSIDTKRAGLLLYGLQIASSNLPRVQQATSENPLLEEIVADPCLGYLAPRAEIREAAEGREEILSTPVAQNLPQAEQQVSSEASGTEELPTHLLTRYGFRNEDVDCTIPRESVLCKHVNSATPCPDRRPWAPPSQTQVLPPEIDEADPVTLADLQAMADDPQIRVPHLRDGIIVAKVGEAAPIHPDTPKLQPTHLQHVTANSCYPDLNHVKQTYRSHYPRRLGIPRRDPRQRHRSRPQARIRQASEHLSQHPHPRQ